MDATYNEVCIYMYAEKNPSCKQFRYSGSPCSFAGAVSLPFRYGGSKRQHSAVFHTLSMAPTLRSVQVMAGQEPAFKHHLKSQGSELAQVHVYTCKLAQS